MKQEESKERLIAPKPQTLGDIVAEWSEVMAEWGWNPVREFVSRLQNLAVSYTPSLPPFAALQMPSVTVPEWVPSFPRFSFPPWARVDGEDDKREKKKDEDDLFGDDDLLVFGNMPVATAVKTTKIEDATKGSRQLSESRIFLDRYSETDIWAVIRGMKIGAPGPHKGKTLEAVLAEKGFCDLELVVDTSDPFVHKLSLYSPSAILPSARAAASAASVASAAAPSSLSSPPLPSSSPAFVGRGAPRPPTGLLMQLFIRRDSSFSVMETKSFAAVDCGNAPKFFSDGFGEGLRHLRDYFSEGGPGGAQRLSMTVIEWLRLQNPSKPFREGGMPLPGQMHPGLGIGLELESLLVELATRENRDGILNLPEHWVNAYLYSKGAIPYRFLNPAFEGYFQSIVDAVEPEVRAKGLPQIAWAIFRGMLFCIPPNDPAVAAEESQKMRRPISIRWVPQEQVCPLSRRLREYFESPGYLAVFQRFHHPEFFSILWDSPDSELSSSCPS